MLPSIRDFLWSYSVGFGAHPSWGPRVLHISKPLLSLHDDISLSSLFPRNLTVLMFLTEKQLSTIDLGFPSEIPVLLPLHLVVMTDIRPCSLCSTSCQILSQQSLKKTRPKYYSRKSHLLRIGSFDLYWRGLSGAKYFQFDISVMPYLSLFCSSVARMGLSQLSFKVPRQRSTSLRVSEVKWKIGCGWANWRLCYVLKGTTPTN